MLTSLRAVEDIEVDIWTEVWWKLIEVIIPWQVLEPASESEIHWRTRSQRNFERHSAETLLEIQKLTQRDKSINSFMLEMTRT